MLCDGAECSRHIAISIPWKSSYLLHIGRQRRCALLSFDLSAAHLPNEVVQLLLVEDPLAFALHLHYRQLRKDRSAHDTTRNTTSLCVRGPSWCHTTSSQRDRHWGRGSLFGELLGNG